MTVSGGYGASASGTTDANGYFAISIKPTNVGGPYPLSFSINGGSPIVEQSITVVNQQMGYILNLQPSNGSAVGSQGIPFYVTASLTDQMGHPVNGTTINITTPTDSGAALNYVTPSTNVSGSYAPGEISESISFSKTGNQTIKASYTINGTTVSNSMSVYIAIPSLSSVAWTSVTPTSLTAGNTLSITGQALNQFGQGMPNGTAITLSLQGSSAPSKTVYTYNSGSTYGLFTGSLVPTKSGNYTLYAANGSTNISYSSSISVNPGPPASTDIHWTSEYYGGGWGLTSATPAGYVYDQYGNVLKNYSYTVWDSSDGSNWGHNWWYRWGSINSFCNVQPFYNDINWPGGNPTDTHTVGSDGYLSIYVSESNSGSGSWVQYPLYIQLRIGTTVIWQGVFSSIGSWS